MSEPRMQVQRNQQFVSRERVPMLFRVPVLLKVDRYYSRWLQIMTLLSTIGGSMSRKMIYALVPPASSICASHQQGDVEITTTLLPGGPNLRLGPGTVGTDAGQLEWRTTSARHWNIDQEARDLRFFTQDANDAAGAVRMRISENAVFLGENGPANAPSRGTKLFFQGAIGDNTDTIWMARQNQSPDPIFGGDTTLLLMNIGDNGPGQADALFLTYDSIPSEDVGGSGIRVAHQLFMNGDIASPSDARLKTNVQTITDPLEKVLALRGVTFQRISPNEEAQRTQIGLIAQEVEQVLPEVMYEGFDGYKTLAYAPIVSVLIEAIKELEARVAALEAAAE